MLSVMSNARVICYRGQELIAALISSYDLIDEHGEFLHYTFNFLGVCEQILMQVS